ncbi:MAG: carboxymuconolactone decarboxylase [Phenylobacterium sp.]|nr:carboxymuconolactone decarboxylase [Phenylobacterium sp.]
MPPVIAPVPLEQLPHPLAESVARGRANRMLSSSLPVQIWAHRPELADAWLNVLETIHVRGVLPERLRELVRLKIASITRCQACEVARKSDEVSEEDIACLSWDDPRYTPAEQAALRYAELFAFDHFSLEEDVFDDLAKHYSTEQIVELNMFAAIMLAGGRMTYVQRGYET